MPDREINGSTPPAAGRHTQEGTSRMEERPAWMWDGAKAALLEGDRDLTIFNCGSY